MVGARVFGLEGVAQSVRRQLLTNNLNLHKRSIRDFDRASSIREVAMASYKLWVLLVALVRAKAFAGCSRVSTTVAAAKGTEVSSEISQNKPSPCIRLGKSIGAKNSNGRDGRRARQLLTPGCKLQNEIQTQAQRQSFIPRLDPPFHQPEFRLFHIRVPIFRGRLLSVKGRTSSRCCSQRRRV